jgi:hypothetical protein
MLLTRPCRRSRLLPGSYAAAYVLISAEEGLAEHEGAALRLTDMAQGPHVALGLLNNRVALAQAAKFGLLFAGSDCSHSSMHAS